MEECIEFLENATVVSTPDANPNYQQMPVAEKNKDKISFIRHTGTYRYNRMFLGPINAPTTLQRALNIILNKYTWTSSLV